MIEISRPQFDLIHPRIKIFGLGGAGCNALDRIVLDGPSEADLVAINTDAQALTASIARTKLPIGQGITRGLGAGGDPELGRTAAEEARLEIQNALGDANILFLVVGLGGGAGSGAAPVIADVARECNAMVVVFATLPFQFEGKRRYAQAMEALTALEPLTDILICFENDRMAEAVSPKASIQEAFAVADTTIGQSIRALAAMASRRGPVHIGFDEAAAAVRGPHSRALFGFSEASGDNRAHEALEAALKSPLLDRGRRLRETEKVLVQIGGGPDLTLNEVQVLMEELQRYIPEKTQLFFGAAVDPKLTGRLAVTILSGAPAGIPMEMPAPTPALTVRRTAPPAAPATPEPAMEAEPELDLGVEPVQSEELEEEPVAEAEMEPETETDEAEYAAGQELIADEISEEELEASETAAPAPAAPYRPAPKYAAPARNVRPVPVTAREQRAEQMQFEPVNRGRFEKSEPTIVDGQDLDVPTFLRRGGRPM